MRIISEPPLPLRALRIPKSPGFFRSLGLRPDTVVEHEGYIWRLVDGRGLPHWWRPLGSAEPATESEPAPRKAYPKWIMPYAHPDSR